MSLNLDVSFPSSLSLGKNLDVILGDAFDDGLLEKSPSLFKSERARAREETRKRSVVWRLSRRSRALASIDCDISLRSFETFTCAAKVHLYVQCHPA